MENIIDNKKMYKDLQQLIDKLKIEYQFLDIPENIFYEISKEHLIQLKKKYTEEKLISKFKKTLHIPLYKKAKEIYDNNSIILKYIDTHLEIQENSKKSRIELVKLSKFLLNANIEIDFNEFEELFKENEVLNGICNTIIPETEINKNKLDSISNNNYVLNILEIYCINKGIEIIENDYEDDIFVNDQYLNNNAINDYFDQIGKIKVLTSSEEKDLMLLIKKGDHEAKKKFIESNLRLVVYVAKKYIKTGIPLLDLIQDGNVGLIKAVDRFDPNKGFKFSTFAIWWIRQEIARSIGNFSRTIRLPIYMGENLKKVTAVVESLSLKLGREPTIEEISKKTRLSTTKIKEIIECQRIQTIASLDIKLGEKDDTYLEEFITDETKEIENTYIEENMKTELLSLLDRVNLNKNEKFVLDKRFGLSDGIGKTLDEIGKMLGLTRERIRQIEAKAIAKIRYSKEIEHFSTYLDNPDQARENIRAFRSLERTPTNIYKAINSENKGNKHENNTIKEISIASTIINTSDNSYVLKKQEVPEIQKTKTYKKKIDN